MSNGILSCDCCGRSVIEVTCPYSLKGKNITKECGYLRRGEDGMLELDVNHAYFLQVQTQMGVENRAMSFHCVDRGCRSH